MVNKKLDGNYKIICKRSNWQATKKSGIKNTHVLKIKQIILNYEVNQIATATNTISIKFKQ